MNTALLLIAVPLLGAAAVAMTLRKLIHSVLLFVGSWAGVAAFYLWAGAEFVAFAQILVYVGAVSMVALFAVLLTRSADSPKKRDLATKRRALAGILAALAVSIVLLKAIFSTPFSVPAANTAAPAVTVKQLGLVLLGDHAAALIIVGVVLTVALLGAIVIASTEKPEPPEDRA
jgi:NADH:ubiquinone oxidoreductase subunit 6 (subunit J)